MPPTSDPKVFFNEVRDLPDSAVPTKAPIEFHRKLPRYERTPLYAVPALAERLGVGEVVVKDESVRLGLPAFKMLGASWASYRAIVARTGLDTSGWDTMEDLAEQIKPHLPLALATATDGNHGRAVSRIAAMFGLSARIWVPSDTVDARIRAIESEGAVVTVTDGNYDDAVVEASQAADERTIVVSDTSWPGYETVPQWVIDGYSTKFWEVEDQIREMGVAHPTSMIAPMGVGALAAAMIAHYGRDDPRPKIIGSEPTNAACVLAAMEAGEVVTIPGRHETIMAGLSCGTASPIAFPILQAGLDAVVAFGDEWAEEAMRTLAEVGIVAGETGAATLATLMSVVDRRSDLRTALNLGLDDVVLVIVTEGATDPGNYEAIVGRSPHDVAAGA